MPTRDDSRQSARSQFGPVRSALQKSNEMVEVDSRIGHLEPPPLATNALTENIFTVTRNIDCYQIPGRRSSYDVSHFGFLLRSMDKLKDALTLDD